MNPVVYNFALLPSDQVPISLNDRAFAYGDGLFETLIFTNKQIRCWQAHFQRLQAGMKALDLVLPEHFTEMILEEQMQQLLQAANFNQTARLRLQVWRKSGGLYTPASREINYLITAQECPPPQVSVKQQAFFYEEVRLHVSTISAYKTCNALPYVLAGLAKLRTQADEMILMDTEGNLSECIASNLFWWKDAEVFTPSLQAGCIAGVMRQRLMQRMQEAGMTVQEGLFKKESLWTADGVFCCNVAGIQWIQQIESHRFTEQNRDRLSKMFQPLLKLSE